MITGLPFVVLTLAFLGLWRCLTRPTVLVRVPEASLRQRAILNHKDIESELATAGMPETMLRKEETKEDDEEGTLTILSTYAGSIEGERNVEKNTPNKDARERKKRTTPLHAWAKHFHARAVIEETPARQRILALEEKADAATRLMRTLEAANKERAASAATHQDRLQILRRNTTDADASLEKYEGRSNILPSGQYTAAERLERLEGMAEGMARHHAMLTEKVVSAEARQLAQQVGPNVPIVLSIRICLFHCLVLRGRRSVLHRRI